MRIGFNRKSSLAIAVLAAALWTSAPVRANIPLFVTQDDWSIGNGWSGQNGSTIANSNLFDSDASSANGGGNFTSPGGAGTPGSLQVGFGGQGYAAVAEISNEQTNPSFISVFDPGATSSNSVAYNGVVQIEYTQPPIPSGGYFQIGIFLQYSGNGYYGPWLSSSQVPVTDGVNNTGESQWLATIPYTLVSGPWNGFGFGIFANTNAASGGTFYVDGLSQVVPEPASLSLLGLGAIPLLWRRRA